MNTKTPITPDATDTSTGPYSPGLVCGNMVFVSGQGPLDPNTHEIAGVTIQEQTALTLDNVQAVLKAGGCDMNDCVKVAVHLSDMASYDRFNEIYSRYFSRPYPARTLVQSVLLHHIQVEIDVIAIRSEGTV